VKLSQVLTGGVGIEPQRLQEILQGLFHLDINEDTELTDDQVTLLAILEWLHGRLGISSACQDRIITFLPEEAAKITSLVVTNARYVSYTQKGVPVSSQFDMIRNKLVSGDVKPLDHFVCVVPHTVEYLAERCRGE